VNEIATRALAKPSLVSKRAAGRRPGAQPKAVKGIDAFLNKGDLRSEPEVRSAGRRGRTRRTYDTDLHAHPRALLRDADAKRVRGYKPGSLLVQIVTRRALRDVKGDGQIKIEMQFHATVYVPVRGRVRGKKLNRETTRVALQGGRRLRCFRDGRSQGRRSVLLSYRKIEGRRPLQTAAHGRSAIRLPVTGSVQPVPPPTL